MPAGRCTFRTSAHKVARSDTPVHNFRASHRLSAMLRFKTVSSVEAAPIHIKRSLNHLDAETSVEAAARKILDCHGYGFQYATLKVLSDSPSSRVPWKPVAAELAVEVRNRDTRIDLLFEHLRRPMFMVCECKRANPAISDWCFARASWPGYEKHGRVTRMAVVRRCSDGRAYVESEELLDTENAFQIAFEVRTGGKGDQHGSGRGEIEDAATQVCRGVNGLAHFLGESNDYLPSGHRMSLVPAIFTTAKLLVTDLDVGNADARTGKLEVGAVKLREVDWLWLDYPQSRGVQHGLLHPPGVITVTEAFYRETFRRIAVVSVAGVEKFMASQLWSP